jgi:hypothetical protein
MPGHLLVQASIMDNIGRTNLALKYGFASNMAIGGGLASSLVDLGHHAIHHGGERVGMFFVHDLVNTSNHAMSYVPNVQIGEGRLSAGVDFGMRFTPVNFWSFIWEAGISLDTRDSGLYLYGVGGLRIHPPTVPFLYITVGIATQECELDLTNNPNVAPAVYFDIMIAFKT